eukprot:7378386-Prymnesium_polylepis.3
MLTTQLQRHEQPVLAHRRDWQWPVGRDMFGAHEDGGWQRADGQDARIIFVDEHPCRTRIGLDS